MFATVPSSVLTITCPANESVTSTTGQAVAASYAAPTATGGVGPVNITSSPVSGSLFPVGQTTVVAVSASADGQIASCSFVVTVITPLVLNSVPNQTATSSDGNSVRVAFPLPTIFGGIQPYSAVTCNPASGALFPVGTTTDTCVVSDSESPPVTVLSTFSVTVTVVTGSLTVTWDGNVPSDNVTDYQIVYGTVTGQYLASLDTGLSTTGTLTGLTKGVTYYVVVRAFNGLWSGNSNEVSGTP